MSTKIVLVVDDSEIARKDLVGPLNKAGFTTLEAENGKLALDVLAQHQVGLIITDVHMPLMNGIEMCEALSQHAEISQRPPVLVASTETNPEFKTRGKAAGVKGWIIKPIDVEKLVAVAHKIIDRG